MNVFIRILQSIGFMTWLTKKNEWVPSPRRFFTGDIDNMPFGRAFAVAPDRQHWPEIKVEVNYFVWPWEYFAYCDDKVPKRIQLILERRLRKRYINRHSEEFSEAM